VTPHIFGIDPGRANDYTAIIDLRRADAGVLDCIGIERLPLGMRYPDQVEHIADLSRRETSLAGARSSTPPESVPRSWTCCDRG